MAEDWSICQSWVVLFSWNSIGCFDGICLSHWWKGKERLKKILLIFSSFVSLLQACLLKCLEYRGYGWESSVHSLCKCCHFLL